MSDALCCHCGRDRWWHMDRRSSCCNYEPGNGPHPGEQSGPRCEDCGARATQWRLGQPRGDYAVRFDLCDEHARAWDAISLASSSGADAEAPEDGQATYAVEGEPDVEAELAEVSRLLVEFDGETTHTSVSVHLADLFARLRAAPSSAGDESGEDEPIHEDVRRDYERIAARVVKHEGEEGIVEINAKYLLNLLRELARLRARDAGQDASAALPAASEGGMVTRDVVRLRPIAEYHEDFGPVLMWYIQPDGYPCEPPYCGTPNDDDAPDYATHFSLLPIVERALAAPSTPAPERHDMIGEEKNDA